ncbi:MAG: hypothetical protein Kow00122_17450 [Thermoleophilia bacterium]
MSSDGWDRENRLRVAGRWDAAHEPVLVATRGSAVEAVHRGIVVVANAGGALLGGVGDPEAKVLLRSAAKPFQALALVASGAADDLGLSDEELALVCASHSGEPRHVRVVSALLARLGLSADDLACGVHPPVNRRVRRELEARGEAPSPLQNMCSGKHAGMLALALYLGASPDGYQRPGHPVQRHIAAVVARTLGTDVRGLLEGVDGCGVPVFHVTARQAAVLYARLADGADPAFARLRDVMRAHPGLVAGEGRFDTVVMAAAQGRVVAKEGAGGVQGLALPAEGRRGALGCFIKLEEGSARWLPLVAGELLSAWGLAEVVGHMGELGDRAVRDLSGREVGAILPLVGERELRHGSESGPPAGCEPEENLQFRVGVEAEGEPEVARFLRREWPRADEEILGRAYDWRATGLLLVARDRRRVIGVLRGHFVGGVATVNELLVGADYRGRGVGGRLMESFEAEARARRCHKVSLRTPRGSRAESFYRAHGFTREYVLPDHHFGHAYVGMSKPL